MGTLECIESIVWPVDMEPVDISTTFTYERRRAGAKHKESVLPDHWDCLARQPRLFFQQTTDDRLETLYRKLHRNGWARGRPYALRTRNAERELVHLIMEGICIETIMRREAHKHV